MARERIHVRHNLTLARADGGSADPTANLNTHTGRSTLKRSQYQFIITKQVPAGPVQVGQPGVHLRGCVAQVGQPVSLAFKQQPYALPQLLIHLWLVAGSQVSAVLTQYSMGVSHAADVNAVPVRTRC